MHCYIEEHVACSQLYLRKSIKEHVVCSQQLLRKSCWSGRNCRNYAATNALVRALAKPLVCT